jgi:hypothetical protein
MKYLAVIVLMCTTYTLSAQETKADEEESKGFRKENLFTGGSVSLSLGSGRFVGGLNPVLGYSITRWLDGGVVINYTYASAKSYQAFNDKLKQHVYGGGVFTRIFPVKFIFLQGQAEYNFSNVRYTSSLGVVEKYDDDGKSFLVGGGYTTGRDPDAKNPYFYVSILFDIGGDASSPYVDESGDPEPIYRAGINIPLFQGRKNR